MVRGALLRTKPFKTFKLNLKAGDNGPEREPAFTLSLRGHINGRELLSHACEAVNSNCPRSLEADPGNKRLCSRAELTPRWYFIALSVGNEALTNIPDCKSEIVPGSSAVMPKMTAESDPWVSERGGEALVGSNRMPRASCSLSWQLLALGMAHGSSTMISSSTCTSQGIAKKSCMIATTAALVRQNCAGAAFGPFFNVRGRQIHGSPELG